MERAVPGTWEYHEDVVTNLSPEEILIEAIREKLLEHLPQEVVKIDTKNYSQNGGNGRHVLCRDAFCVVQGVNRNFTQ